MTAFAIFAMFISILVNALGNYYLLVKFTYYPQVKMFGVVVAIFMVCWAPYHIYFILSFHFPQIARKEWISNVYLAVW